MAEAARHYAKAAKLGIEAQNHAAEIKIRAERKAGELLGELERGKPNPNGANQHVEVASQTVTQPSEYKEAIDDIGVSRMQANRWQDLAKLPEETFEGHIEETKAEGAELTTSGLMRKAQEHKRERMRAEKHDPVSPPDGKSYRVLYADPPWSYGNSGVIGETDNYGRAARHYPSMSIDELCEMGKQVKKSVEDDALTGVTVANDMDINRLAYRVAEQIYAYAT